MSTDNKVSVPSKAVPSATLASANTKDGPGNGAVLGGNIKGFGSGKPDSTTINAVGGSLAKAPKAEGKSVAGFSGNGMKPGII